MNTETIQAHRKKFLREDGMLFVRTDGIIDTMTRIPLLVASLIIVVALIPIQSSFGSPRNLDLMIYPDGTTHVSTEIDVDPLSIDHELDLFGSTIDNFVVINENGFLLNHEIIGNSVLIETFDSSIIFVEYDIHDLVSKQSRVWTFFLNSPSDFTLLFPKNSAIIGMTNLPIDMQLINDQNQLTLSSGETEINYLFSTPIITTPVEPIDSSSESNYLIYGIVGGIVASAIIATIIRVKQRTTKLTQKQQITPVEPIDTEEIFKLKPDIREDDKELVRFISNNGGQALESELRKKFLQPRTTMWRAVKRLERNGIIEIEKKDLQNLVKLRKNMGEEE